ncbi:TIGR01841 family phasin [Oxalobacteraceae bacterium A2-2]
MYPYSESLTPAARNHLEAQMSFFNDMTRSLFRTAQQYQELNLQLAQTLLEESAITGQRIFSANRPTEAITAAASHAQPATDKLCAYHQHISRMAADTQANLAQVAEQHAVETSRTAKALAEEVARVTSEETEKGLRAQQEAVRKFTDPFQRAADGAARPQQDGQAGDQHLGPGAQHRSANGSDAREHTASAGAPAASATQAAHTAQGGKQQPGVRKDS